MERPRTLSDRIKGIHNFAIEFNGRVYTLSGHGTLEKFVAWFNEYAPKAPVCANKECNEILLPGTRVGKLNDNLYHIGKCVDNFEAMQFIGTGSDRNGGCGYINEEGKFLNNWSDLNKKTISKK